MPTLPPPSQGGDFAPPPAGTWPAICYRIIDLGRQQTQYMGQTKVQHKIIISWEIADEEERMADGRPWTVSNRYTWSMSEKSTLRHHLEAWRGKAFEEADFGPGGFDIRKLLGVPCMLTILNEDKGDKTYTNVTSVAKLPKNMIVGQLVNEIVYVWLEPEEFDKVAFDKLSDNLKQTIIKSPEYAMLGGGTRPAGQAQITSGVGSRQGQLKPAAPQRQPEFDDGIPEMRG